jgi:hypothetical protein
MVAAVAATLPWTLPVYSTGGVAGRGLAPGHGLLRAAAIAIVVSALAAGGARLALSWLAERIPAQRRDSIHRRFGRTLAVVSVLALAAGCVVAAPWVAREYRAFTSLHVNEQAPVRFVDASGFRYDLWRVALHEFRTHPLGGVGAGNYDLEYYRLRNNPQYVVQPHSLEMQMAAELGIGGIAALLLFCGAILCAGFARRGTLASEDRLIKLAAVGMFTSWLADTSVDWLYDIPGLTGMAIVAGALLVVPASDRRDAPARGRRSTATLAFGLVVLALLAASIGRQYAATRYARHGASLVASTPGAAIGPLKQAARLDPYSLTTLYSLAAAFARGDDYPRARATLLVAAAREPHNYVPPALLGDLAVRRGDYRQAAEDYRRALALNPSDVALRQAQLAAAAGGR